MAVDRERTEAWLEKATQPNATVSDILPARGELPPVLEVALQNRHRTGQSAIEVLAEWMAKNRVAISKRRLR